MTLFFMEKSLPICDEILKVSDLGMIYCRVIDFRDDTVPQGEPDSARRRVSGSHPVFIPMGPSRFDARPSESCVAMFWFHLALSCTLPRFRVLLIQRCRARTNRLLDQHLHLELHFVASIAYCAIDLGLTLPHRSCWVFKSEIWVSSLQIPQCGCRRHSSLLC